ncbi:MAG: DNA alkylation repair protein [Anaerolineaceae bacterium]
MSKESDLLAVLQALGKPENLDGMRHFGMAGETRLGIPIPELRRLAKEHGKDHLMAVSLWHSGIPEARILASMIENPEEVSIDQLEEWVADFNAWDVCDQVCMNLFEKVPAAVARIPAWAVREEEFVRRTAFSLIACLAWHDKKASNGSFIAYFSLITQAATDERNFVKKAVNWALRNIGKRNQALNQTTIALAEDL